MDVVLRLLDSIFPAFAAFWSLVFVVAAFLDWKLKGEIKERVLEKIYGKPSSINLNAQIAPYYRALSDVFAVQEPWKFFRRSIIASCITLAALSSLQAAMNSNGFESTTRPFISALLAFDVRALILLGGVFVVDCLSIYQTITFLRISRHCSNIFEITFVAFADILVSLVLFIVIFPIFVTTSFLISAPKSKSFQAVFSSTILRQNTMDLETIRRFTILKPIKPSEEPDDIKELPKRRWFVRSFSVALYDGNSTHPDLKEAISNNGDVGSLVVQVKGNLSDQKVFDILSQILKERDYVSDLKVVETNQGFFSAQGLALLWQNFAIERGSWIPESDFR